ncbi:hypothetical protein AGABI1DRAFT_117956 [Agaricus bisporus var. burnettii JB137-S8]|uniref:Vacuolar protein sorting-associated protein 54 C-terminal domain-containing protein n=1 Tax=Agaricus bisporus var. burnettii (strain JB137-S8 / ATCC MYA-4627 / FGSC 10392) TaxID=597362 RepID=K5Y3H1_AGABU|nr:uncharacterized protein AGABI1DRAFT_117956 [Agaricus bisporus var. burnettii JB137-S8]EKM82490.1 hypothetical protein AGABI1DRAFT_117956 [Agaricus bisporus var. burnettii JB137-S8]
MSEVSSVSSRPPTPSNLPVNPVPPARPYRFTWDPSTRRPGPESVSGTTEGRGADYFNQQTPTPFPLGALNPSAAVLESSSLPNEWSSSRHGFHAISTVLNNPRKKQAPPKAHSHLPAVPPAELPRVRRKDFDSYLRAISPEWKRFERNTRLGSEGQAQLDSSALQSHGEDVTPRASISSDQTTPRIIPTQNRAIPPLESVPSVFFQQGFTLADPKTFAKVTEQPDDPRSTSRPSSSSGPTPVDYFTDPSSSLSYTPPLLDKFSHYADTVEQHLVREISIRSTSFFAALTNLQDLQSESDLCLDRISQLRGLLKDVDEKTAMKGLDVVKKGKKVDNVVKIKKMARDIEGVVEMTRIAKGFVSAGQWGEALTVVEELETLWEGETQRDVKVNGGGLETMPEEDEDGSTLAEQDRKPTVGFPLSALAAFSELPSHLQVLTLEIATSLSQELVIVLRHDLEQRALRNQSPQNLKTNGHTTDSKVKDESLRDRLKPLIHNLVRTKGLKDAILKWREDVLNEVRSVVKKAVSGFDKEWDEDKEENKTALIQHLKDMEYTTFMPLLQGVYKQFMMLIESIQIQNNIMNDLLESLQIPNKHSIPTTSFQSIAEDLADLLSSTTELSHTTSAKLLQPRTETHSILPIPQFLALYYDSMAFVVKCEVICRRMVIGLRGVVIRQASVYLGKFHQGRVERCARVVLDETWNQVEVGGEIQDVVDVLVKCAVRDAMELNINAEGAVFGNTESGKGGTLNGTKANGKGDDSTSTMVPSPSSPASPHLRALPTTKTFAELGETVTVQSSESKESTKSGKGNPKHLKIEDRSYYIVSATAEILVLLIDYLKLIVNLSTLTKDTINKVVEFLMTFNSRTCQLVLGAGAMRSAGLKHITAKHLALASQSLSVVSELIPYVRETFRRHLNQAEAVLLVDFDKLKRDYQVHQTEIHAKLISIMGDRLTAHIESLKAIDWAQPNDGGVNAYMQTLVKETVTLHKVLSRYLSAAVVEVFAGINHRLSEVYGKIELPSQDAKLRLLADTKFLHKELSGLKNVMASMGMLETVVSEKQVGRANMPSPSPMSPTFSPPKRSNTISANQRLKGLLSRSSTIASKPVEKALRSPDPMTNLSVLREPILSPSPSSPLIDGTEDKPDQAVEFMLPSQQNEIKTPVDAVRTQAPLPEIPLTEKEP